jgi:hypothetical protein
MNIRSETLKLLEENIGGALQDTGIGSDFLNTSSVAQEITRIDKCE